MRVVEIRREKPGAGRTNRKLGPAFEAPVSGDYLFRQRPPHPEDIPEYGLGRKLWPNPAMWRPAGATDQFLSVIGIPSQQNWGTPTITGGVQTLQLYLGGVLMSLPWFAPAGTGTNRAPTTITSQAIGRATATFDLIDTNGSLVGSGGVFPTMLGLVGLTVKITELGYTLFAGCIDTVDADIEMGTLGNPVITYHCTALDKASICDHRIVPQRTYQVVDPQGNPLIVQVSFVILDIVSNCLNGEGITTQGVPQDGSLGTLDAALPFNYVTVRSAFDTIASMTGTVWWIDQYGVLNFSPFNALPAAPFSLTTSTRNYRKLHAQYSISGSSATSGYRNKQYVVSNLNAVPGGGTGGGGGGTPTTETFTYSSGSPGIIDSPPGVPYFVVASLPIASVVSMTFNGSAQTVENFQFWDGKGPQTPPDYGVWFYLAGYSQLGPDDIAPPGGTVVLTYIPGDGTNSGGVGVGTAFVPSGNPLGGCGSGVYEDVQQVKDISSQSDLNALATAYLARSGGLPHIIDFETDQPGLFVGQLLSVLIPQVGMGSGVTPVQLLITKTTLTASTGPLEFNSWFQNQVEAVSNLDPGGWLTYYSRLIERSANAMPVLQYEEATFVLAPGGSLSAGLVTTNPYIVSRTGLLVEMVAKANSPPTGQDMILTILDGLVPIAAITIPAGDGGLKVVTIPAGRNLYVFRNDVLSIEVTYINIGGSPVPASNVTAKARWTM